MNREPSSAAQVLPGAEPYSHVDGPAGALVVHGFTGTPQSLRPLAEAFAAAGFSVELPLLPGHGTSLAEMLETSWDDWSAAAEGAYLELAGRCRSVVVAGLSMGGTLSLWLASRHPEIAGVVTVNAACPPPNSMADVVAGLEAMIAAGETTMDAIGSDIADPTETELAYERTPLAPLVSLLRNAGELAGRLSNVGCPVLVMNSPQDHVVDPAQSDHIATSVRGPVERLTLSRSYHVATLDYDRDLIQREAVEFARRVSAA